MTEDRLIRLWLEWQIWRRDGSKEAVWRDLHGKEWPHGKAVAYAIAVRDKKESALQEKFPEK